MARVRFGDVGENDEASYHRGLGSERSDVGTWDGRGIGGAGEELKRRQAGSDWIWGINGGWIVLHVDCVCVGVCGWVDVGVWLRVRAWVRWWTGGWAEFSGWVGPLGFLVMTFLSPLVLFLQVSCPPSPCFL